MHLDTAIFNFLRADAHTQTQTHTCKCKRTRMNADACKTLQLPSMSKLLYV